MIHTFGYLDAMHIVIITFLCAAGWLSFWIALLYKIVIIKSNNGKGGMIVMTGKELCCIALAILLLIIVVYIGLGEVKR